MAKAYLALRKGRFERIGKVPRTRFNGSVSSYRVFNGDQRVARLKSRRSRTRSKAPRSTTSP
jgi:hypothetical protein